MSWLVQQRLQNPPKYSIYYNTGQAKAASSPIFGARKSNVAFLFEE